MAEVLPESTLALIRARDEAAGDGVTVADSDMSMDRHLLLAEVDRLRAVVARLREGRPVA